MDSESDHLPEALNPAGIPEFPKSADNVPPISYADGPGTSQGGLPQETGAAPPSTGLPILPGFDPPSTQSLRPAVATSYMSTPLKKGSATSNGIDRKRVRVPGLAIVVAVIAIVGVIALAVTIGAGGTRPVTLSTPTTSTQQDFATQENILGAMVYVRYAYPSNHDTFVGITPASLGQNPHDQLTWESGPVTSGNAEIMSLAVQDQTAVIASLSATGACWFARVNMHVDDGALPTGMQLAGQIGGQCNAQGPPTAGWGSHFPPQSGTSTIPTLKY